MPPWRTGAVSSGSGACHTPATPLESLAPSSAEAQHWTAMTEYAVAHLSEIDELNDGRAPFRPVRHHFGITSFGVNAWTGHAAGDRLINEHDEAGEDEELYVVQSGRATFELDGERVDAPAGTFVYARPGVKRTAYAEEPDTTILAVGGAPGEVYEPSDALAAGLGELGVAPGDRVAVYLQNVPQFVLALLATFKAGAIMVPVNP